MRAIALADLLPDFGAGNAPQGHSINGSTRNEPEHTPAETIEERVAREVAQAQVVLSEKLAREREQALAAERERHAAEMQETIARLADQAAATIATRFHEAEQEIVSLTSALAARVLGLTLTEDIRKRAVEDLARVISEALSDREAVRIRVRGPELLREALKEKLGERSRQVDFSEGPDFDLSAEIEESLFETRIAEWSEALAEVLS
ncbi:hypothetical protein [Chelativorans sp. J32]|uniref:hypothetical protein n=1 Tax=Chelativorans sp. J32 TaxID=935840 RepID=UPI000485C5E9|nr:hypothetical protein [Chelativorans sp. J32]